jgi:hypothetical protein
MSSARKIEDKLLGYEQTALDFQRPPVESEDSRVWRLEERLRANPGEQESARILTELEALRPGGFWNSMIWFTDDDLSWWPISETLRRIREQYGSEE